MIEVLKYKNRKYYCPCEITIQALGSKWKPLILWRIRNKNNRFGLPLKSIPEINRGVLSRSLRELESDNVISKKILSQKPLNIEYEFTEFGMTIIPVLEVLAQWGKKNAESNRLCSRVIRRAALICR